MLLTTKLPSESPNRPGSYGSALLQKVISTSSTGSSGKTCQQATTASASKTVTILQLRGDSNLGRKMGESEQIDLSGQPRSFPWNCLPDPWRYLLPHPHFLSHPTSYGEKAIIRTFSLSSAFIFIAAYLCILDKSSIN